jgi:hypothetical protein
LIRQFESKDRDRTCLGMVETGETIEDPLVEKA